MAAIRPPPFRRLYVGCPHYTNIPVRFVQQKGGISYRVWYTLP
ncbi:hypothetical protein SUBVAR_06804 [Subdoligranulum variabile DSM 15176]|uniref:Uncharacterized protein n=1 Tax=Subdoligranulum variabile DSM 15176 TaxID=411471 RepID=D1PQX6_9FIRM|nr:hypothetical protein SUBVAR_06804 [Subdoligranulum variabile DSM 15176]